MKSTLNTHQKDWSWGSNILSTWCKQEKTLMLGKIEGRRGRGRQRMRWLNGITDSMDVSLSKLWGVGNGQGGLACCSAWGHKESDMTELNWTELNMNWTELNWTELKNVSKRIPFYVSFQNFANLIQRDVMDYLAAIHERRTDYFSYYRSFRKYGYGAESITISFSKGSSVAGQ